jgi:hypothetical protein
MLRKNRGEQETTLTSSSVAAGLQARGCCEETRRRKSNAKKLAGGETLKQLHSLKIVLYSTPIPHQA